jgi:hypothetical protein
MSAFNVPRNDLGAARAFYEAQGFVTPDQMQHLLMLQDDTEGLLRMSKRWKVRDPDDEARAELAARDAELARKL